MKFNKEKTIQLIKNIGLTVFVCLVLALSVYTTFTMDDATSEARTEYIMNNW
jgi:hypothetical protein